MFHPLVHLWWWFQSVTGTDNTSGRPYGFWSGFGSDLGEIAILAGLITIYKHHNCAVPRCPRLAHKRFEVKETHQRTCHKHATKYWHDLLLAQYKEDYPEQHALLNPKTTETIQPVPEPPEGKVKLKIKL